MRPIRKLSIAEQTAEHMREGIRSGRWRCELPGVLLLAKACDVSKDAMRDAMRILEAEGLISPGQAGVHRMVLTPAAPTPQRALRVAIFPHEPLATESRVMCDLLRDVKRDLRAAGHTVDFTAKTQIELNYDPKRIAKLVAATPVDAWVLGPAPRQVQDFFASQSVPTIGISSLFKGGPIASVYVDAAPVYREVTRRLIALGHRRIVMICPRSWWRPVPSVMVQAFIEELAAHGIVAGEFNVPDYDATTEGVQTLLKSLFRTTPPTALIVMMPKEATAAFVFLAQRGLAVPRDVSLFLPWRESSLQLCDPPMGHVRWDEPLLVRRIVRWVRDVARGRADREAVAVPAFLEPGGSLGPVKN